MFVFGNKQYSMGHIAVVEFLDQKVSATDPRDGQTRTWFAFSMRMSNGTVEQMLFETQKERDEKWETLVDAMERAGY